MSVQTWKSRCIGVLAAALLVPLAANAQAPKGASVKAVAAASSSANRWTCVSRAMVEIAPVSYDTAGEANAWVRVYRVKGEIVAAERVNAQQVEQLRRLPCGTLDSEDGGVAVALLGGPSNTLLR